MFTKMFVFVLMLALTHVIHCQNETSEATTHTAPKQHLPKIIEAYLNNLTAYSNDFGFVEVRRGAKMFWWLFYSDGVRKDASNKPLIIWIQGGPGYSGSGLGNFYELGPFNERLKRRKFAWTNGRNVLFMDSPVGAGFSTVNSTELLCKTDNCAAMDLEQLIQQLLIKYPEFRTTPVHIFSQSYGTKVAARLAINLKQKISNGTLEMNLKSVAFGGAFISPLETLASYCDFLLHSGFTDDKEYKLCKDKNKELIKTIQEGDLEKALDLNIEFSSKHTLFGQGINNIYDMNFGEDIMKLDNLMLTIIRTYLAPVGVGKWTFLNGDVYKAFRGDFLKPAHAIVEKILNDTDLTVSFYNGNLDPLTPIAGFTKMVHKLNWEGREKFASSDKTKLNGGVRNGFFKVHKQLSMWWIHGAGHHVPRDNPVAMEQLLNFITTEKAKC